jgi:hypothetical protein
MVFAALHEVFPNFTSSHFWMSFSPFGLSDTFLFFYLKYVCALAAFDVNHPAFVPPSMLEDPSFGAGGRG